MLMVVNERRLRIDINPNTPTITLEHSNHDSYGDRNQGEQTNYIANNNSEL